MKVRIQKSLEKAKITMHLLKFGQAPSNLKNFTERYPIYKSAIICLKYIILLHLP
jgi:hypothetical protein